MALEAAVLARMPERGILDILTRTGYWIGWQTAYYVHWFNTERLLEVNGDLPPTELEQVHYRLKPRLAEVG